MNINYMLTDKCSKQTNQCENQDIKKKWKYASKLIKGKFNRTVSGQ